MPSLAPPNKKKQQKRPFFFDNQQKLGRLRVQDQFPPISAVPFMVASMEASVEASLRIPSSQMLNVWYIYLHLYTSKTTQFCRQIGMCGQIGHTLSIWEWLEDWLVLKNAAGRTFFGYDLDHTWRQDEDLGDNKRTFERTKVSQLLGEEDMFGDGNKDWKDIIPTYTNQNSIKHVSRIVNRWSGLKPSKGPHQHRA